MATKDAHGEADGEYFARRAREEASAAAHSSCPEARELHERMAELLDRRASGAGSAPEDNRNRCGTIVRSQLVTLGKVS